MKILLSPAPPEKPTDGGVMNVVHFLSRELIKLGHDLVSDPKDADVIHGHAFDGSPNVYTSHGIYQQSHENSQYNRQLYQNISTADITTAVSQWTVEQFNLIHRKVEIIHNGVDPERLAQYRSTPSDYVLWAKNTADELSNAAAFIDLAWKMPEMNFVMTVALDGVPLPNNLRVIGLQPFDQMMKWLGRALVYVSTGTENFATQIPEAMALGVPVVALPRGGTKEVNGIYLTEQLDDGVRWAVKNRGLQAQLGVESVAENYSWDKIAKQYVDVYERSMQVEHNGKISVVIPCYNLSKTVARAVQSCLKQSRPPDEIIVVDDGSTDNPENELEQYSDYITFYRTKNQGVSAARNLGISKSTGEFICCLDADDAVSGEFFEWTHKIINRDNKTGIAYTGMTVVAPGSFRPINDFQGEPTNIKKLARMNVIPCCNLFRRKAWEAAGGYKKINPSWEDYDLWLSMLEVGYEAQMAPRAKLLYTSSDTGRTGEEQRGNHSKLLRATVDGFHPLLYGNIGKVSFVIPCYNQWKYVYEAVESAWKQTYPHIEVIVVDDASTENREYIDAVVSKLTRDFPQTVVHHREKNGGLSAARNTGISLASGGWIVPLDADDKVAPDFVAECLKVVYNTTEYAYTDLFVWHNEGRGPLEKYEMSTFDPDRLRTNHQHACTTLYRKDWADLVGGYDEGMRDGWEDYEFAIRMVKSGHCGIRIPKYLFYYRYREDGMRLEAEKKMDQLGAYIWAKHRDVAQGASLMSCCGGNTAVRRSENPPPDVNQIMVPEGFVLMQYQGLKTGQMTRQGGEGRVYVYEANNPNFLVHEADTMVFNSGPFVLVKSHQQSIEQATPPPDPPAPIDINDVFPEGDDDLSALGDFIDEGKQKAMKASGLNTYARVIAASPEQLAMFFDKREAKKVQKAAIDRVRESVGV